MDKNEIASTSYICSIDMVSNITYNSSNIHVLYNIKQYDFLYNDFHVDAKRCKFCFIP